MSTPFKILPKTLAAKLFLFSAMIVLSIVVFIGAYSYWQTRTAVNNEVEKHVSAIHNQRQNRIFNWLAELQTDVASAINFPGLRESIALINSDNAPANEKSVTYNDRKVTTALEWIVAENLSLVYAGLYDNRGDLFGFSGHYTDSLNATSLPVMKKAAEYPQRVHIGKVHLGKSGVPLINVAKAVTDKNGEVLAIYLGQYDTRNSLDPILTDTTGLGDSGECYLLDEQTVMLTPSRYYQHPQPLTHKMPIPPALSALDKKKGILTYTGFLGEQVIGVYTYIPEMRWTLITEVMIEEAFAPVYLINRNLFIAGIIALILTLFLNIAFANAMTKPLKTLADASLEVASGKLDVKIPDSTGTIELRTLTGQFNRMIEALAESRIRLQKSHESLVQSEKLAAVGRLSAAIVHEMRNPLSAIKMNLQILSRGVRSDEHESEHISLAAEESERLDKMLTELLNYSKPVSIEYQTVTAQEIIKKTLALIKTNLERKGMKVETEISGGNFEFSTDPEILLRVLTNLLNNAMEASGKNDKLTLKFSSLENAGIVITIDDNGPGMPEFVLNRIFDPFFTTRENGIGLGMPNVKKFVETMNGNLEVYSKVGQGTTVTVTLQEAADNG